jgi:prepilin-type N-terminal cleavage/methylation domain-containing protein
MIFRKKVSSGFTLIELLVTISIFVILTGVVIFNQGKFNSTVLLTNLAYDTALTIRQAQTYGINVKEFGDSDFIPYGVHFDKNEAPKSFILFADVGYKTDTSSAHPYAGTDLSACQTNFGCVNRYTIQRGNYISDLVVNGNSVGSLDIVFKRPNPDAIIYANGEPTGGPVAAVIQLTSADGTGSTTISVWSNGLIEIN